MQELATYLPAAAAARRAARARGARLWSTQAPAPTAAAMPLTFRKSRLLKDVFIGDSS
jgi:hypothetical protein